MGFTKIEYYEGKGWQIEWWSGDECIATHAWFNTEEEAQVELDSYQAVL